MRFTDVDIANAQQMHSDGKTLRYIGEQIGGIAEATAYYLVQGFVNSRDYANALKEREKFYSRKMRNLDKFPHAGYNLLWARISKSSIFAEINEDSGIVGCDVEQNYTSWLAKCYEIIDAEEVQFHVAAKGKQLKIIPKNFEARASLKSLAELVEREVNSFEDE